MRLIRDFWPLRRRVIPLALLTLALTGCSKPAVFHADDGRAGDPKVPFHQDGSAPDTPGDSHDRNPGRNQDADAGLPFDNSAAASLPAGTLLTVRLENPLSSSKADVNAGFSAIIEVPIVVEGKTVVARGARVRGRVESARASEVQRDTGYLRLTLDSIDISGREVPLQTSSLFARGNAGVDPETSASSNHDPFVPPSPRVVQLTKGRRLTFRLTSAVALHGASPSLNAGNPLPTTE